MRLYGSLLQYDDVLYETFTAIRLLPGMRLLEVSRVLDDRTLEFTSRSHGRLKSILLGS